MIQKPKLFISRFGELFYDSFKGLPLPALIIFVISTVFSVAVFNQGDLTHTTKSSFAFLNGHVFDFYEVNKVLVGGNDYFPLLYVVFALWFIPLKVLGFADGTEPGLYLLSIELLWAKLLLITLFLMTLLVLNLITRELFKEKESRRKIVLYSYLLSPFALFASTIFGQYDVIGVLFTLLGFLYYLRGKTFKFVLFFALAISLKFFAVVIFVPLLVLKYKQIRKIALLLFASSLGVLAQVAIFWGSPAFRECAFRLASAKTGGATSQDFTSFVAILFLAGCYFLWRANPKPEDFGKYAVFAVATSFGLMFEVVVWHPQWVIILTPFFALAIGFFNRPSFFLIWEGFAFFIFIWCVVNWWVNNVDNTMIERGPFRSVFNHHNLLLSDIYASSAAKDLKIVLIAFFISPILYLLVEYSDINKFKTFATPSKWIWISRALLIPAFWTVPTIIALVIPISAATAITDNAPSYNLNSETVVSGATAISPVLLDGDKLGQKFTATKNNLSGIGIKAVTYARSNSGKIEIKLLDDQGNLVASRTINSQNVLETKRTFLWFDPIPNSKDSIYSVEISSKGNSDPNKSMGFSMNSNEEYQGGELSFNGAYLPGDIELYAFYK